MSDTCVHTVKAILILTPTQSLKLILTLTQPYF